MNFDDATPIQQAADAHNIGADNSSMFADVGALLAHPIDTGAVSLASGLNSFYNTGIAYLNIFNDKRDQIAYQDTGELISSFDDDLGKYYSQHKTAADLTGFIATSLIPGTLGIKGLKAAQGAARVAAAGEVGSNFSRATGLLAPATETFVKREAADLSARSATFSFANGNAIKAVASGAVQGTLESLAFETAVAATMFKSPIFEGMDGWDIVKNIGVGGVFGGALGAIGSAATTYYQVNKLLKNADARQVRYTGSTGASKAGRDADSILVSAEDRELVANPVTADIVLNAKIAQGETGFSISSDAVQAETRKLESLRQANVARFDNEIRTGIRKITKSDEFGNQVADTVDKLDSTGFRKVFYNALELVKLGDDTAYETKLKAFKKAGLSDSEAKIQLANEQPQYIRLHSGTIGDVISGSKGPGLARLADKYTSEQLNKLVATGKVGSLKVDLGFKAKPDFRELKSADEIEARWLYARKLSLPFPKNYEFGSHDLPMLDKAVRDQVSSIKVAGVGEIVGQSEIKDYLIQAKHEVLAAQKAANRGSNFLERVTDLRRDYIEGAAPATQNQDELLFAQDHYAKQLSDFLGPDKQVTAAQLHYRPAFIKGVYDVAKVSDENGHLLEGMALLKYREKLATQSVNNVFAKWGGQLALTFPEISDALLRKAWRGGSGSGLFSNAGGSYGSLEQQASYIGTLTSKLTEQRIKGVTDAITPVATKLASDPKDVIRFSTINEIIANSPEKYVLNDEGTALIPRKLKDWEEANAVADEPIPRPELAPGTREEIQLETKNLQDAVKLHISMNTERNRAWKELNATYGQTDVKHEGTFYPVRPNPRDYKHVAFVKDESLIGVGHTRMLFANDAAELEKQIAKVQQISPHYKVYTTNQAEDFYNAQGEWKYDKTLHENYIDTDMTSRGVYSRFFPQTDPQKIISNWLADHVAKENTQIKAMVLAKYERPVAELRRLGEQFSDISSSAIGRDTNDILYTDKKNPYVSVIKAMLNVPKSEELPVLFKTVNQGLDSIVSKAWRKADDIVQDIKGTYSDKDKIDRINEVFEELGFKSAYYDGAINALANAKIPRGNLTQFVRTANAFLTTTVLRLDPFNTLNSLLGNTILFSSELSGLTSAIKKGSAEGAGDLAKLANIVVPGVDDQIFSPAKLIANAYQRLHGPNAKALIAEYEKRGLNPDLSSQYYKALDSLTLHENETVATLNSKSAKILESLSKMTKVGEKYTGNRWAEQFNRLVSADVAKQITEVAVKHGIIGEEEAWAYVHTFSNRVNGVIRAAERPMAFQGPVGQSIGLFQSYQFNLMQQVFRHIGEGNKKQLAILTGLQGSIYGASSLPGFNLINHNLIGDASGNTEHKDLYSATQLVFGKTGAEWLMFGAPSNILRGSLYTRGDTNPRTWSIVPNPAHPSEIPFISAFGQAAGSIKTAVTNVASGAPVWQSMLGGIEHLGFSRPLAGIAQVARAATSKDHKVIATQGNGSILYSNDLASWATAVRILGAKPIDQAAVATNYYNILSYASADQDRREKLGESLKATMLGGGLPTQEQVNDYARRYVELGGKQTGFNQWMMGRYIDANKSQARQLAEHLNSPYARQMQFLMGGRNSLADVDQ